MVCNLAKTELIMFGLNDIGAEINGCLIKLNGTVKILGVFIKIKATSNLGTSHLKKSFRVVV